MESVVELCGSILDLKPKVLECRHPGLDGASVRCRFDVEILRTLPEYFDVIKPYVMFFSEESNYSRYLALVGAYLGLDVSCDFDGADFDSVPDAYMPFLITYMAISRRRYKLEVKGSVLILVVSELPYAQSQLLANSVVSHAYVRSVYIRGGGSTIKLDLNSPELELEFYSYLELSPEPVLTDVIKASSYLASCNSAYESASLKQIAIIMAAALNNQTFGIFSISCESTVVRICLDCLKNYGFKVMSFKPCDCCES